MKTKYFQIAKKISILSDHPQFQLGSVIVNKNKVIGVGYNTLKTSPRSPHKYNTLHAEVMSVINSRQNVKNCDVYIYRETKDGMLACSKPCASCENLLRSQGIRNIYYSDRDGFKKI